MSESWKNGFEHPAFQRRVGRPPKPADRRLDFPVCIRFPEKQWEGIAAAAKREGISHAEWCRRAIARILEQA